MSPGAPSGIGSEIPNLVFIGFNSRVFAVNRDTGQTIWEWKSPQGYSSYVSVVVDEDRLFVSVQGYFYCLDPVTGATLWSNPFKGKGVGIPSIATWIPGGNSQGGGPADAIQQAAAANSAG